MAAAVCTLFEGHYHYGVAALTNSLYRHGFRGDIYAGYRGNLPVWASAVEPNTSISWQGSQTFRVADGLAIHFVPVVKNDFHLAHYKPDFMLSLMEGAAKNADGIFYFDPDIVIKCRWGFFENWMGHGVALVHEIVSNDMPPTHPSRKEWEKVIAVYNKAVTRNLYSYLNSGFCGVAKKNIEFLRVWCDIIRISITHYKEDPSQFGAFDRTLTFGNIDQDSFNITAMCCNSPISELGPEGMDFRADGWTMSHATGSPKPWKKNFLLFCLDGWAPSKPEKEFWIYSGGPVKAYSETYLKYKRLCVLISAFIGRFYSRN